MMQFEGTTIFVNSALVREIAEEAGLHGFFGVIVCCLAKVPMVNDIAIPEFNEMARQLKHRGIVPHDCCVRCIGPALFKREEQIVLAGLIVNYTDA
jgi:hypothetical protein